MQSIEVLKGRHAGLAEVLNRATVAAVRALCGGGPLHAASAELFFAELRDAATRLPEPELVPEIARAAGRVCGRLEAWLGKQEVTGPLAKEFGEGRAQVLRGRMRAAVPPELKVAAS